MAKNPSKNTQISNESPKIYAYVRTSTLKQFNENQEYGILKFADTKGWKIDEWVREQVSGTKKAADRELSELLQKIRQNDILLISEVSRLGRSTLDTFIALASLLEKKARLFAIKEGYEFKDDAQSEMLAFGFSFAARIERDRISARTTEALALRKAQGVKLGRPEGSQNKDSKLSGKETDIENLLKSRVAVAAIARIVGVDRRTVKKFAESKNLKIKS